MTFNKAISPSAETGEEQFALDEMLISCTDKRGVIRYANEVFRRLSGLEWDRLVGAPYRSLRHPDMPKAVFWLLWKTIQADKPMVAYVKNRSATGRWYWVLAAVIPIGGGYVSASIKPTSPLVAQVRTLYSEVLAAEQTLSPEKAADLMLQRLGDLGFASHADFAARALDLELGARDAATGATNAETARILASVGTNLTGMGVKQADLMREFDALQSIPTNMRIIASRLEPSGGPISAISDNYKFSSTEIARRLEAFAGSDKNLCTAMSDNVRDGLFLSSIARLMSQLSASAAGEGANRSGADHDAQHRVFQQVVGAYSQLAQSTMLQSERVLGDLNTASGEIRRMMLGLDTIRVMGRVESGRLGAGGVGLSATIDQLDTRHAIIAELLQSLMDLSAGTKAGINAYLRQFGG